VTETLGGGRYRIERVLGSGGMAIVYLARDLELDRPVAVKLLAENLAGDEAFRERFLREARHAAALSHPNVAAVFDAGEEDERPYIVMEYLDGETLAEVIARRGPLEPAEAVELALQACAGLEHAHRAGLVHRDVKPQNLLLGGDGAMKLVDFGIARAAESTRLTEIGTVLGTAAYLAPEQAAGEDVGAAADIYSLGAVLYELLSGRPPFEFGSLAELASRQREGAVTPLRDLAPAVPEELEEIVMRSLARKPEFRPASAREFASKLAAASPAEPTEPLATMAVPTAVAQPRRYGGLSALTPLQLWLGVAAAAALLVTLAGVGVSAVGGDSSAAPPVPVKPVPHGRTSAEQARNLAAWIRANSR
jgi:eukaryotic-like serine/threonine-protein kinase